MNTTKNLHEVSAILFFSLALVYVGLGLMLRNDFVWLNSYAWIRILDIPLAFVALLYAATGFQLQLQSHPKKIVWSSIAIATCALLFALVIFINLSIPG